MTHNSYSTFRIKLYLFLVILLALASYNYPLIYQSNSRIQKQYIQWLEGFEEIERKKDTDSFRHVNIKVVFTTTDTATPSAEYVTLQLNSTKSNVSFETVSRLLELLKESKILNWGTLVTEEQSVLISNQELRLTVDAPGFNRTMNIPLEKVRENIVFQTFLKILQVHAS